MTALRLLFCFVLCLYLGAAVAAEPTVENQPILTSTQPDRVVSPFENVYFENGFDPSLLQKVNFKCGIKPIPPIGCKVSQCVCDSRGQSCRWTFSCR